MYAVFICSMSREIVLQVVITWDALAGVDTMARSEDTSETTVMRPMIGLQSKETWRRLARKHKASFGMQSLAEDGILIYVEVLEK
ncbi:hypothetical protein M8J75_005729 [Diaphorina citri]|nr:hypothetical protein M8J75_005729 [Diaphorina citri]